MPLFAGLCSHRPTLPALSNRTFAWTLLLATLLASAFTLAVPTAQAQISYDARYRPQADYRFVDTERFEWIYPAGADASTALFQGALLRSSQGTRSIVGTDTEEFELPIVVDPPSSSTRLAAEPTATCPRSTSGRTPRADLRDALRDRLRHRPRRAGGPVLGGPLAGAPHLQ